jgi:hypothetical protein
MLEGLFGAEALDLLLVGRDWRHSGSRREQSIMQCPALQGPAGLDLEEGIAAGPE